MSETGNSDKTVTAAPPKATLHLKRPVEQGTVRQSFSHGRSKAVVVEKVKRRILTPGRGGGGSAARDSRARRRPAPVAPGPAKPVLQARPALRAPAKPTAPPPPKTGVVLPTLTAEQREARARALIDARAAGGGGSPPPGGGGRSSARARGARPRRTRGRGSAQARGRASPRAGSQFQAAVGGRSATAPFRRRTGAVSFNPARCPGRAQRRPAGSARPSPAWRRRGRSATGRSASGARAAAGAEGRRPDASADAHRRAAQSWPADRHQRDFGRGGAHAFGRRVPSPHAAAERPRRAGPERENRA